MRYTEKKYDFKFDSPHDFVRILFCTTFLAPFRFFNEMSKKVLFLGKKSVKELVNTGIVIAGLLFAGEAGYQIFFTKLSLFNGHIPLLAVAISIVTLVLLNKFIDSVQLEDMDIFEETDEPVAIKSEEPQPMSTINAKEAEIPVVQVQDDITPITEEFMNTASEAVTEMPQLNPIVSERLKKYDNIMADEVASTDSILDELFEDDTNELYESMLNPINDIELSGDLSNNTKELLKENYTEEKIKFDDLVSQFDNDIDLLSNPTLDLESIGGELIDDFDSEDFNLEDYFV